MSTKNKKLMFGLQLISFIIIQYYFSVVVINPVIFIYSYFFEVGRVFSLYYFYIIESFAPPFIKLFSIICLKIFHLSLSITCAGL